MTAATKVSSKDESNAHVVTYENYKTIGPCQREVFTKMG